MKPNAFHNQTAAFEQALKKTGQEKYILRLYVTGATPRSLQAIDNIKRICEEHLHGRYSLEVVDVYQQPVLAKGQQIVAAPTLIRHLPLPLRRFIGDMANTDRILLGLDLRPSGGRAPGDEDPEAWGSDEVETGAEEEP
jgi:circadian clock protein KaiB